MTASVLVVGSYNRDHIWHVERMVRPGETLRGHGFATKPGGKGFNQAVACARQDVATAFLGARGDDAAGEEAARVARDERLQGFWQVTRAHPTGSACIVVDERGENRIIVDLGANETLAVPHLDRQAGVFEDARAVLTQMETSLDSVRHALARGREHGLLTLLNPAPVHPQTTAECLRLADVLIPNESEFAELCARLGHASPGAAEVAHMDDETLHALARRLTDATVVVTLGAAGCFVSHGDQRHGDHEAYYRLAAETVKVLDTTGAGDAFCGSLAASRVRLAGQAFRVAAIQANRTGALATERRGGATAAPYAGDVTARFP